MITCVKTLIISQKRHQTKNRYNQNKLYHTIEICKTKLELLMHQNFIKSPFFGNGILDGRF